MADLRFPLFLDISGKEVLVVGGGKIAARRVKTLLSFGAKITVCAPEISPELGDFFSEITILKHPFEPEMCKGFFIVLAASNDSQVNSEVCREAASLGILYNNASDQSQCSFFFPAVILGEDYAIGLCGTGENHKKIREIAEEIRAEWGKKE